MKSRVNGTFKPAAVSVIDDNGNVYETISAVARKIGVANSTVGRRIKSDGYYEHKGVKYYFNKAGKGGVVKVNDNQVVDQKEFDEFKRMKDVQSLGFAQYSFNYNGFSGKSRRYAVALFSDAHIEETVNSNSVLGLNEYNINIAEKRIQKYFVNLVNCINADNVSELIFASLGDTISGYIHEELAECNGLSPLEATYKAQSLIASGLEYICKNTKLASIKFIGIVGNHSRTTKKIHHANGFKLSYEWLMYKNIEDRCKSLNLPIEFAIPESEVAVVNTPDNKKFIFAHGFQIKGSGTGTVCGIYPALNRLSMKWRQVFGQDRVFIGHFHQWVSISNAVVNGSIIGYNTFALSNGMAFEEPCQYYGVFDNEMGEVLERKIYCK